MSAAVELEPLLTVEQVAALLVVTPGAVYNMVYRGEGPRPTHVGRRLRFAKADVEAYLRQQRESA